MVCLSLTRLVHGDTIILICSPGIEPGVLSRVCALINCCVPCLSRMLMKMGVDTRVVTASCFLYCNSFLDCYHAGGVFRKFWTS